MTHHRLLEVAVRRCTKVYRLNAGSDVKSNLTFSLSVSPPVRASERLLRERPCLGNRVATGRAQAPHLTVHLSVETKPDERRRIGMDCDGRRASEMFNVVNVAKWAFLLLACAKHVLRVGPPRLQMALHNCPFHNRNPNLREVVVVQPGCLTAQPRADPDLKKVVLKQEPVIAGLLGYHHVIAP